MLKQMASAVVLSCVCATAMAADGFDPIAALAPEIAAAVDVVVGDVTGDGRDDVVLLTASVQPFYRNRVIVYRQVAGGFAPAVAIDYHPDPTSFASRGAGIALADLDNDADLDIVVSCGGFQDASLVVLRNTAGSFAATAFPTQEAMTTFAVEDVNGDGNLDVIGTGTFSSILTYPGDGAGGFGQPVGVQFFSPSLNSFAVVDMDGDGRKDLVHKTFEELVLRRNEGTGFSSTTRRLVSFGRDGGGTQFAARDVNADGRTDLVLFSGSFPEARLDAYLQTANGTFMRKMRLGTDPGTARGLVIDDLNGDGRDDLLTLSDFSQTTLNVRLASPTGGFGPALRYPAGGSFNLKLGDLNDDGRTDVVLPTRAGGVSYMLGNGAATGADLATFIGVNAGAAVVRVKNRGTGLASGGYTVDVVIEPRLGSLVAGTFPANCSGFVSSTGALRASCQLPSLAVGTVRELAFPFTLTGAPGGTSLTARATASRVIGELRTDNNTAKKTVRIAPQAN